MRALRRSLLLSFSGWIACVVALSGFFAFEGYDKTIDRMIWFLWYNLGGSVAIFSTIFVYNWIIAPGRLLRREVGREAARGWLHIIDTKKAEAGKLIEAIHLGQEMEAAQQDFERWRENTRQFFVENLPLYELIFDDVEMGPFAPLLDLPAKLLSRSPPGFSQFVGSKPDNAREALVDMISRRRANLCRIYERLLPVSISGDPNHA